MASLHKHKMAACDSMLGDLISTCSKRLLFQGKISTQSCYFEMAQCPVDNS